MYFTFVAKAHDIVILHPTMPSESHLKELEYIKGLYFIKVSFTFSLMNKGTGLSYYDLQRAGIERASSILIRMSENAVNQSGFPYFPLLCKLFRSFT